MCFLFCFFLPFFRRCRALSWRAFFDSPPVAGTSQPWLHRVTVQLVLIFLLTRVVKYKKGRSSVFGKRKTFSVGHATIESQPGHQTTTYWLNLSAQDLPHWRRTTATPNPLALHSSNTAKICSRFSDSTGTAGFPTRKGNQPLDMFLARSKRTDKAQWLREVFLGARTKPKPTGPNQP